MATSPLLSNKLFPWQHNKNVLPQMCRRAKLLIVEKEILREESLLCEKKKKIPQNNRARKAEVPGNRKQAD